MIDKLNPKFIHHLIIHRLEQLLKNQGLKCLLFLNLHCFSIIKIVEWNLYLVKKKYLDTATFNII